MTELMIVSGLVLLICITSSKVLYKFGVPILLIFILLGMLFGSDGMVGIYFDNYELTKQLCSIGLIFIMFLEDLEQTGIWLNQLQYLLY